jgi:uncharacterized protein YndB with AHSA1/START domain
MAEEPECAAGKGAMTVRESDPIVVEQWYDVPPALVWEALTDPGEMKQWLVEATGFKPEVGCEFGFSGGTPEKQYLHPCRVVAVEQLRTLTYSWRYEGYGGDSVVTWSLTPERSGTRLRVIHEGVETVPPEVPDLWRQNFVKGWNSILSCTRMDFLSRSQVCGRGGLHAPCSARPSIVPHATTSRYNDEAHPVRWASFSGDGSTI